MRKYLKNHNLWFIFFIIISVIMSAAQSIEEIEHNLPLLSSKERIKHLNKLAFLYGNRSTEKVLHYSMAALKLARQCKERAGEADALRNLGYSYYFKRDENEKALASLCKALKIYKEIDDKTGIAFVLNNTGIIYLKMNKNKEALRSFLDALKVKDELGDEKSIANTMNNIGLVHWRSGDYNQALEYFLKALAVYEGLGDFSQMGQILNNIGLVHQRIGNFDDALEYYLKALEIIEERSENRAFAVCANNIGLVLCKLSKYDEAMKYHLKSLEVSKEAGFKTGMGRALNSIGVIHQQLKHLDEALAHFNKSLKIQEELGDKQAIANTLLNIGNISRDLRKYTDALVHLEKSLKLHEELGDKYGIANTLNSIAYVYFKQCKYDQAFLMIERSLKIAKPMNAKEVIKNNYELQANLYEEMGNYKAALVRYKRFTEFKDIIFTDESNDKILQLQTKYQTLEKEKEIEILKKNKRIQDLVLNRQKMIRNVLIFITLLVLIIFAQFFKQYRYLFTFWKKRNYISHYRLVEKIASGGMGEIYCARDMRYSSRSKGTCAVKVLKEEYYKDENYKRRFKQEAAVIDQLHHPNIVRVKERGEFQGNLYIAMELLKGQTLSQLLECEGKMTFNTAFPLLTQMADALMEIHKRGIIHRDLKPENMMVTKGDSGEGLQVKILDFGLARNQNLTRMTRTGLIMGTINYIAPEHLSQSIIVPAGDIYSLGVIFYQLLTGETPFSGDTVYKIARQVLKGEGPDVGAIQSEVPQAFSALVRRMMAKDHQQRPSAAELLNLLKRLDPVLNA